MYFTQALTVALSLSAAVVTAAPAPIVRGSQGGDTSKLMLRSVHESQIAARSVGVNDAVSSKPLQTRGLDSVSHLRRAIDLRFGDVDPQARDLAMVTELHRRGLLDQLVAALRDLIITLLGKGGGMSRRQSNTEQLEQAIHQVTCILDALFGNSDESCSDVLGGSSNSTTNATSTATNKTMSPLEKKLADLGAELRNGTSITQVVDGLMAHNGTAAAAASKKADKKKAEKGEKGKHLPAKNATSTADTSTTSTTTGATTLAAQKDKRSFELLEARQNSGLEGLLVALRDVVDTILNTLLPMASRGESEDTSASSTSSARWPPQDCPPPTPNDGMYRPGCPGYGRRDLAVRRSMQALGERDANILQTVMPMIEMLLQQLPSLIQSMASSPSSTAAGAAATASAVTGSAKNASPTSMVDAAFAQIISALGSDSNNSPSSGGSKTASSAASAAKAQATGASDGADGASSAARSAANLSQNFARDLLNSDGMNLGKRQADTTTGDGISNDNCDASGNSGGINVSLLNNLLNGLLSGFSRRSADDVPLEFFKRQNDGTDGDNSIGSGNCSASNNTGGVNLSLLDNLLNGLLSGFSRRDMGADGMVSVEALQRDVADQPLAARSAPETFLQVRADFAPVWSEIKKIGNEHFHAARDLTHTDDGSTSATKRAAADNDAPNFTPVWEAIRDLVDSGYKQASDADASAQRRDAGAPLKLDYKPLMKAGIKYGKQLFKSFTTHHAKRSTDYKPFIDAASNFAVTAVKEMFKSS
ncbi:uncharacterized protein UTRI_10643_B [Ustilago trichophora]|uniref:Uncharacterized protein n=1 Tax=Ustilago trichophora TaxID=86804 RepID=A0A5C3EC03_9BASI|nr:uncharacterized protein UTRI_10643_B [Ustilago trichophora]